MGVIFKSYIIVLFVSIFVLAGCSVTPTYESFHKFKRSDMAEAKVMPDLEALRKGKSRVLVLNFDDIRKNKEGGDLGEEISKQVETVLVENGIEVVDRDIDRRVVDSIKEEIQIYKNQGIAQNITTNVTDYVVYGEITEGRIVKTFKSQSEGVNQKNEKIIIPARHMFDARAEVSLDIYELPNLTRLLLLRPFETSDRTIDDGKGNSNKSEHIDLLTDTFKKALRVKKIELVNALSHRGYVVDRRSNSSGEVNIFQINLGKSDGMKKGSRVQIFSQVYEKHPIYGERVSLEPVGMGSVTELVENDHSWLLLEEPKLAVNVRTGDVVKVVHKKSMWDKFSDHLDEDSLKKLQNFADKF